MEYNLLKWFLWHGSNKLFAAFDEQRSALLSSIYLPKTSFYVYLFFSMVKKANINTYAHNNFPLT